MKKLTLSLFCAGVISTASIAEDLCNAAYQAGNYTQSEQCYIKQLKKERSFNNLYRAGVSLYRQERYQEALPYATEAEKKAQSLDDYAVVYSLLGTIYRTLGNLDQAYVYYMKSLDIELKIGSTDDISTAYNNLGTYYFGKSQYQKALEFYEKSLSYQKESKKGVTYNNLAELYVGMGDVKKAEEMYLKAIANDERFGNYSDLGSSKANLGAFYYNQSRYDEAKTVLYEALNIAQKAGLKETEINVARVLALIVLEKKTKK
jgi:tetratricopeptide (TPR) repeat protein